MSRLARMLRKNWSATSVGASYSQPPFWSLPDMWFGPPVDGKEPIPSSFEGYVQEAYKASGIVFACIQARMMVFTEARFQFQAYSGGQPGDLYGTGALSRLEKPWSNGTTGELLARMLQDADLAGNFYATVNTSGAIRRLRPDWVTIITGSPNDDPFSIDAEPVAYVYEPKAGTKREPVLLLPEQVVHWSPTPDPEAQWRGMSWLTPVLREIESDKAATDHKGKFFENGAVANFAITYDKTVEPEKLKSYVSMFKSSQEGAANAYKTLHIGGGADLKTVGADMRQLDFKATQGAGETRIAAAAGVPPVWAGFSEGLAGSSLNAGNFAAARRRFADGTIRPLWRTAAAALAKPMLVSVPAGSELAVDTRNIAFLREDAKDAAEILRTHAETVARLVDSGYDPDAVVAAVRSGDLSRLAGKHSGLYSVQLQPAGAQPSSPPPQEPKQQTIHIDVDARATHNLPEQPAPVISLKQEPTTVNVDIPAIDARTTVNVEPAQVTFQPPADPARKVTKTIEHTADGRIAKVIEETE